MSSPGMSSCRLSPHPLQKTCHRNVLPLSLTRLYTFLSGSIFTFVGYRNKQKGSHVVVQLVTGQMWQSTPISSVQQLSHVMPSNHLILCHPLSLVPSIFPSIRVFSNESVLHIRWSKYWRFSFTISPSNKYSGLISFRIDWFDLLAVLV